MDVFWITNYPSPYRVLFFNELGKKTNLTVAFENTIEEQKHRNRAWFVTKYCHFDSMSLKKLEVLGKRINIHLEIFRILRNKYDRIVLADFTTITQIISALLLILKKKDYGISIDGAFEHGMCSTQKFNIKSYIKHIVISHAQFLLSTSFTSDKYLENLGARKDRIYRYNFTSLTEKDILNVPISSSEKEKISESLGLEGKLKFLYVGQFVQGKGLDFIINSAAKLPDDIHYYFVGGKPTDEYNNLIRKYDLSNIHFIDFQKKSDLQKYYQACDVLIFPTRHDYWGLVINEAMANGLAILSSDRTVAGVHFIKNGRNGFLFKSDDENGYIQCVMKLYNEPELITTMGLNNLNDIKNYTIEKMASQVYDVLKLGE